MPLKNSISSLRRLEFMHRKTSTKNAVQEFQLRLEKCEPVACAVTIASGGIRIAASGSRAHCWEERYNIRLCGVQIRFLCAVVWMEKWCTIFRNLASSGIRENKVFVALLKKIVICLFFVFGKTTYAQIICEYSDWCYAP
jgi:hypothetical protein